MKSRLEITLATTVCFFVVCLNGASAQDANAVIDKGIKALGGEEQLTKVRVVTWKAKGKITRDGNDNEFSSQVTLQGLDQYRSEFEGTFGGNNIKGVTVINGDKGWRKFGDTAREMDAGAVANEKRNIYLQVIPATLVRLKGKDFKTELAGEEKIADKPAVAIKVTAPDGKDFKLYFDKESGLPVRLSARVAGFRGEEYNQETTFSNYQVMGGIKKAAKVESKRDGEPFIAQDITDFKVMESSFSPETFAEPK